MHIIVCKALSILCIMIVILYIFILRKNIFLYEHNIQYVYIITLHSVYNMSEVFVCAYILITVGPANLQDCRECYWEYYFVFVCLLFVCLFLARPLQKYIT